MSGENPVCQHVHDDDHSRVCTRSVRAWRSCGRGCKHVTAYCSYHGGTERAEAEMIEHHKGHSSVVATVQPREKGGDDSKQK